MRTALLELTLLLAMAGAAAASPLGTLFHTPEERARLERLRRGEPVETLAGPGAKPALTGFVRRSDGRNTVWINGVPVAAGPGAEAALEPRAVVPEGESSIRIERSKPENVKP